MQITASIIISTRDRAEDLRGTLASLAACAFPAGFAAELLVVDNGSTDATPEVIAAARFSNLDFRPLREPMPGKSRALNRAMKEAGGRVLVFTDDDVRVPAHWVTAMCRPILEDGADGVCGGVRLAPHLMSKTMSATEQGLMVSSEHTPAEELADPFLIGVNMAFRRDTLEKLGGFDVDIGPGTPYAACEDVLFSLQFKKASFKIKPAMDVIVEHHLDPSRLSRAGILARPRLEGKTSAYIRHHWGHENISLAPLRMLKQYLMLAYNRVRRGGEKRDANSCPDWEIALRREIAFYHQYLTERKKPRNYAAFGLWRRDGGPLLSPAAENTPHSATLIQSNGHPVVASAS